MVSHERPRSKAIRRVEAGLPPHDIAAEEAVLAACMILPEAEERGIGWNAKTAVDLVRPILKSRDFFRDHNGWIFDAILQLDEREEPTTSVAVAHELERAGQLEAAGGEYYLVNLIADHFTSVGVEAHARIVARDALYRRLISAASQMAALGYEGGPKPADVLRQCETLLLGVQAGDTDSLVAPIHEIELEPDGDASQRIPTGFGSLDRLTRGLKRGQISVWGAGQDSGKTALMLSCALRGAFDHGVKTLFIPLEDTPEEAKVRLAAFWTGKSYDTAAKQATDRAISSSEWAEFQDDWKRALQAFDGTSLHLPKPGRTPADLDDLETMIRATWARYEIDVVWIDYLDVLGKKYRRGQSTADVVSEQMTRLLGLAVRLNIHIAIGSQVSNEGEREANQSKQPPAFFRLLDSGGKARVARMILMLRLAPANETRDHMRALQVRIEKLKGYPLGRMVELPGQSGPALYMDTLTGLVKEVGE